MSNFKNIANIITVSRIIAALPLAFIEPFTALFSILYIYCGISDISDGYIARKTKSMSRFGAILDSSADVIFFTIVFIRIVLVLTVPEWLIWWIGLVLVIRINAYIIGFVKYKSFSSLHTYLNKITGLFLFAFPLSYVRVGIHTLGALLCFVATVSALEELLLTIKLKELQRDVKSIFHIK